MNLLNRIKTYFSKPEPKPTLPDNSPFAMLKKHVGNKRLPMPFDRDPDLTGPDLNMHTPYRGWATWYLEKDTGEPNVSIAFRPNNEMNVSWWFRKEGVIHSILLRL